MPRREVRQSDERKDSTQMRYGQHISSVGLAEFRNLAEERYHKCTRRIIPHRRLASDPYVPLNLCIARQTVVNFANQDSAVKWGKRSAKYQIHCCRRSCTRKKQSDAPPDRARARVDHGSTRQRDGWYTFPATIIRH
jgi:hypothetical protein